MFRLLERKKKDRNSSFYYRSLKRSRTSRDRINLIISIESPLMRERILRNWDDESLTMSILLRLSDENERRRLLKLIHDQNSLSFIARRDPSKMVREAALDSLHSLALIIEILTLEDDPSLVIHTLTNREIKGQECFALLEPHRKDPRIMEYLLEQGQENLLLRFLCMPDMTELREEVLLRLDIERIPEEAKLSLLRVTEKPEQIRFILTGLDIGTLAEIAKGGNRRINEEIRHIASEQNIPLLQQLVFSSSH